MKTKQLLSRTLCSALFAGSLFLSSSAVFAQVKVGDSPTTINNGSVLELESTSKGLLLTRVSLTNTSTWGLSGTAVAGMHVYNSNASITSTDQNYPILDHKTGEYYWDGTGWVAIGGTQSADAAVRVKFSGNQNVPSTPLKVNFTTSEFDKNSNFNLTTDDFTVPSNGYYFVSFAIESGTNVAAVTGRAAYLYINGIIDRGLINDAVPASTGFSRTIPSVVKLNAGDKVSIYVQSNPSFAAWAYTSSILDLIKISN